jgi:hypothetical protein
MLSINNPSTRLLISLIAVLTSWTMLNLPLLAGAEGTVEPMNQSSLRIDRSSLNGSAMMIQVIAPADANLNGTIKINGQVAANLQSTRSLSLQKCLALTTCEIDLAASYNPNSSIEVKIYSTNGAINSSYQSSGEGQLKQRFSLQWN